MKSTVFEGNSQIQARSSRLTSEGETQSAGLPLHSETGLTVAHVKEKVVPVLALVRPGPRGQVEGRLDRASARRRHQRVGQLHQIDEKGTHYQTGIHSGAMPNMRAVLRTVMTEKTKATLSRVRKVFCDSHELERF